MDPNLTYSIFVNPTLNATLHQPETGLDSFLKTNFIGIAQVVTAVALAYLTFELLKATSRYANQVETQTRIMEKNTELSQKTLEINELNREKEKIKEEMDKLIGPLYSRINDQQIFNPLRSSSRYLTDKSGEIIKRLYEESAFWQNISQYKYLAPPEFQLLLDNYLEIKIQSFEVMNWEDSKYKEPESALKTAIKQRYNEIVQNISVLDKELEKAREK